VWELGLLALLALATVREGVFIGFGKMGPVMLPLDRHVVISGPTRSIGTPLTHSFPHCIGGDLFDISRTFSFSTLYYIYLYISILSTLFWTCIEILKTL